MDTYVGVALTCQRVFVYGSLVAARAHERRRGGERAREIQRERELSTAGRVARECKY